MTRQQNVTAAQWSANGGALGDGRPDRARRNQIFGANVFSLAEQRQRLPKDVFKRLQATLERGEALDAVARRRRRRRDEGLGDGERRDALHALVPAADRPRPPRSTTPSTARPATARRSPSSRARSSSRASPTRRRSRPAASARPSRPAATPRGTRRRRRSSSRTPTARCCASRRRSRRGRARRWTTRSRCCARWTRCRKSAVRALRLFGDERRAARLHDGRARAGVLPRSTSSTSSSAPTSSTRAARCSAPSRRRATSSTTTTSARSPSAILACMLEAERELQKLGVPIKTRHNEVAPNQYELAPIFENSNVGSDHQQLTMQVLQNVARRYGLVCLLHEKPFAGVNGSGKHNNWSMGTDTGQNLLEPGDTPHENLQFLFFCAAVIAAVEQAPGAAARVRGQRRPGPPPRRQRGAAGDHLDLPRRRAREGVRGDRVGHGRRDDEGPARAGHAGAAAAADARRRPQPDLAVRLHRQQVRVPRARARACRSRFPNTVLNTIVAEAIDELSEELENEIDGGASLEDAVAAVVKETYDANKQIVFDGDGYSDEWHAEAEQRGLLNLRTTPDALPWIIDEADASTRSRTTRCSPSASSSRASRSSPSSTSTKLNIEAETAASHRADDDPARRRVRHLRRRCRAAGIEALVEREPSRLVDELVDAIHALEAANARPPGGRGGPRARQVHARHGDPGDGRRPRGRRPARAARRRRPLAAAEVLGDAVHQVSSAAERRTTRCRCRGPRFRRGPRRSFYCDPGGDRVTSGRMPRKAFRRLAPAVLCTLAALPAAPGGRQPTWFGTSSMGRRGGSRTAGPDSIQCVGPLAAMGAGGHAVITSEPVELRVGRRVLPLRVELISGTGGSMERRARLPRARRGRSDYVRDVAVAANGAAAVAFGSRPGADSDTEQVRVALGAPSGTWSEPGGPRGPRLHLHSPSRPTDTPPPAWLDESSRLMAWTSSTDGWSTPARRLRPRGRPAHPPGGSSPATAPAVSSWG